MADSSWSHRIARVLVRPLVGGPVRPNHITTVRLFTGLVACAAFAVGEPIWTVWGGGLWLVSTFLDRVDGELARLSGQSTQSGHRYDCVADIAVNSLFFVGIGVGLRASPVGVWSIVMGIIAGTSVATASLFAERLEQRQGGKAYSGAGGFDFDDVLYLFAPAAWMGWLFPLLVGATIGAPVFTLWTWLRLYRSA